MSDVWQYRGLLLSLGIRDLKLRYKQTLFGVAWVVLQPLLSAGILTAVFGFIAAVPSPAGVPYFVFAYLGQMPWTLFSLTLARTSGSMVGSMTLVMKIYFPRPILPLATILSVLLDFAISFAIAIPMVVLYGRGTVNLVAVASSGIALVLCAAGIGFVLSAMSVRFRDVLFVLPVLVQLGLYASPVAYGLQVARDNLSKYSTCVLRRLHVESPGKSDRDVPLGVAGPRVVSARVLHLRHRVFSAGIPRGVRVLPRLREKVRRCHLARPR